MHGARLSAGPRERRGRRVLSREGGLGGLQCLIPPEDAHGFATCCASLPEGVFVGRDHGVVSLVGQGVLEDKTVVVAALALLADHGIEVRGLSTSSFRVSALVDPAQVPACARLLHDHFIVRERAEAAAAFA